MPGRALDTRFRLWCGHTSDYLGVNSILKLNYLRVTIERKFKLVCNYITRKRLQLIMMMIVIVRDPIHSWVEPGTFGLLLYYQKNFSTPKHKCWLLGLLACCKYASVMRVFSSAFRVYYAIRDGPVTSTWVSHCWSSFGRTIVQCSNWASKLNGEEQLLGKSSY